MTELHPAYLFELTRALVSIGAWWVLFYRLHRPPTKLRRIVQIAAFGIGYTAFMLIPLSDTGNVILWAALILLFALMAGIGTGGLRDALFTGLYYTGIEAAIDTIRHFVIMYIFGKTFRGYTTAYYVQFNLQYLFVLGWAFFYYWIMKGRHARLPLRFWVMTVIPPFATMTLLTRYADTARPLLAQGTNIYIEGILFGIFLFAFNLFTFYLYVKLAAAYDARGVVIADAEMVPLYTPEGGISRGFVEKHGISGMEKKVVDTALLGKTNKEISDILFIASRTV
ncbi:MAG: hypothetical protein LBS97_04760, partial [Treponema sp.]|nr:hypothetical protein [Treponema sp.]